MSMRKALICLLIPFLCITALRATAQEMSDDTLGMSDNRWIPVEGAFVRQIQPKDSILIGDQLEYGFRLNGLESEIVPIFEELQDDAVEVLEDFRVTVLDVKPQGKDKPYLMDIEATIKIAVFEDGKYELPPLRVTLRTPEGNAESLSFAPIEIDVKTIPVDTLTFQRHGMKDIIEVPYDWDEFVYDLKSLSVELLPLLPWIIGGKWLIIIIIVGICLWRLRGPGGTSGYVAFNEPAHVTALRKLDGLRSNALWVPEKQKEFYSGVTDALREYISRKYRIGAMEMTTAELFEKMNDNTDLSQEQLSELHDLFDRADFVKFAKYVASDEDNAATVPVAVRFVTFTYQAELQAQQEAAEDVEKKK